MKKIVIEVVKYEALNGSRYNSEEECVHQDKIIQGTRKVCGTCHGTGSYQDEEGKYKLTCERCSARGWLEKSETWS